MCSFVHSRWATTRHSGEQRFFENVRVRNTRLQEDFRLGHNLLLCASPGLGFVAGDGRTRSGESFEQQPLLGLYGALQQTQALGDGLVRAAFESSADYDVERNELRDTSVSGAPAPIAPRRFPGSDEEIEAFAIAATFDQAFGIADLSGVSAPTLE